MKILISYSRWHPGNRHSKLFYFLSRIEGGVVRV